MAIAAIITKIMPDSPEANFTEIKNRALEFLESRKAKNISFGERDIAFGLKAIIVKFAWPEEQDTSIIEDGLAKIPHVSSVMIEDYRRAFG